MARDCDIVIVGGGPAGLMTAWHAARKGTSVILIDRKKTIGEPVRCGEGTMLHVLKTFDLAVGKWMINPLRKIRFFPVDSKPIVFDGKKMGGIIIDRVLFEQEIARRARECGAELLLKKTAVRLEKNAICLDSGDTISARIIIGADGVESAIGRKAGLIKPLAPKDIGTAVTYKVEGDEWDQGTAEIYMGERIVPGGYAWLFPTYPGKANVGVGFLMSDKIVKKGEAIERFEDWRTKRIPEAKTIERNCGSVPTAYPMETAVKGNIMLVGDAARHSYAVAGGGIHSALFDGFVAGQVAAAAVNRNDLRLLAGYDEAWRTAYLSNLKRSYKMRYRIFDTDKSVYRCARVLRVINPFIMTFPGLLWRFWWGKHAKIIDRVSRL